MGWGALLSGVVTALGKWLSIEEVRLLRKHSDEYLALERALLVLNQKPYDDMDDLQIAAIKSEMIIVKAAFERDMMIVMKTE